MQSSLLAVLVLTSAAAAATNRVALWRHPRPAPAPAPTVLPADTPLVLSGTGWTFRHHPARFGVFTVSAGDHLVEHVPDEPIVLLTASGAVSTLCTTQAELLVRTPTRIHNRLETTVHLVDANGRTWTLRRTFRPENEGRELLICTDVTYDPHHDDPDDARVFHVPYLTLLADRASGGHKRQALLAGLEYLADENSSSARDIPPPFNDRRIPAEFRFTAPLAVLTSKSHWLAALWRPFDPTRPERFAAVFDSPDRIYRSGGHLLAFWAPAVGHARAESSFTLTRATPFRQGRHTLRLRTGPGSFVTDALDAVLTPADFPPLPTLPAADALARLAADGRDILRHAPNRLLAAELLFATNFPATHDRLVRSNQATETDGTDGTQGTDGTGGTNDLVRSNQARKSPDRWNGETCGELARRLRGPLERATWSGDETEIARVLAALDRLTIRTRGNVPRGGHSDLLPPQTPDLQAATDLAACYTAAYLLRPRESTLRDARRWATAGLAFIRLAGTDPDNTGTVPDGAYMATAAFGMPRGTDPEKMGTVPEKMGTVPGERGTGPLWIGHPRTEEALAYAGMLPGLARIEPTRRRTNFWRLLARGMTRAAVRQLYPKGDPLTAGLLPAGWDLIRCQPTGQVRDPFALQALAAEETGVPFASCRAVPFDPAKPSLLHVPGSVTPARKIAGGFSCVIACWPEAPCRAVLTRVGTAPRATFEGADVPVAYDATRHVAVLTLPAKARGKLTIRRSGQLQR